MLLNCPKCKSPVGGTDINIQKNIGQCPNCDHLFRISDALDEDFNNEHKTNILMPEGIEVVPGLQLDIKLTWRKLSRVTMYIVLGSVFTGIVGLVGILAFAQFGFMLMLFMSLFLLVGLSFLFRGIANLLNTTYITASSFDLQIEHRPINFFGWKDQVIDREEITQLFVERYEESRTNDRANYAHNLLIVLQDGREEKLITGLKDAKVAFYLEHQIEKRLGLQDRPMAGEYIPGQSDNRMLLKSLQQLDKMPKFLQRLVEKRLNDQ